MEVVALKMNESEKADRREMSCGDREVSEDAESF